MKRIGSRVLLVHAVVVVALAALFLVLYLPSTEPTRVGTDIDLLPVFPWLALAALGLPWSLDALHSGVDAAGIVGDGRALRLFQPLSAVIWPALINVVVHALIRMAWVGIKGADARP